MPKFDAIQLLTFSESNKAALSKLRRQKIKSNSARATPEAIIDFKRDDLCKRKDNRFSTRGKENEEIKNIVADFSDGDIFMQEKLLVHGGYDVQSVTKKLLYFLFTERRPSDCIEYCNYIKQKDNKKYYYSLVLAYTYYDNSTQTTYKLDKATGTIISITGAEKDQIQKKLERLNSTINALQGNKHIELITLMKMIEALIEKELGLSPFVLAGEYSEVRTVEKVVVKGFKRKKTKHLEFDCKDVKVISNHSALPIAPDFFQANTNELSTDEKLKEQFQLKNARNIYGEYAIDNHLPAETYSFLKKFILALEKLIQRLDLSYTNKFSSHTFFSKASDSNVKPSLKTKPKPNPVLLEAFRPKTFQH